MEININKMCSISINKCFAHTYNFWIYESAALCIQKKKNVEWVSRREQL